jgi:hypothetical protein
MLFLINPLAGTFGLIAGLLYMLINVMAVTPVSVLNLKLGLPLLLLVAF